MSEPAGDGERRGVDDGRRLEVGRAHPRFVNGSANPGPRPMAGDGAIGEARLGTPPAQLRQTPILDRDAPDAPSLFTAEAMLDLARRQKGLSRCAVPQVCVLDPDGDVEQYLRARGALQEDPNWGCFHTRLGVYRHDGRSCGIIGRAVGGAFSVLLAEQLFASGCEFLISLSSAGQIEDLGPPPYFVVIERAIRDEGTSYHYLEPSRYACADPKLVRQVVAGLGPTEAPVHVGLSWTTDAPFRETEKTVAQRRLEGVMTVEMEAASLYAYATARGKPILCLAQVTNRLHCAPGDFAKGAEDGAEAALRLIAAAASAWEDGAVPPTTRKGGL